MLEEIKRVKDAIELSEATKTIVHVASTAKVVVAVATLLDYDCDYNVVEHWAIDEDGPVNRVEVWGWRDETDANECEWRLILIDEVDKALAGVLS